MMLNPRGISAGKKAEENLVLASRPTAERKRSPFRYPLGKPAHKGQDHPISQQAVLISRRERPQQQGRQAHGVVPGLRIIQQQRRTPETAGCSPGP